MARDGEGKRELVIVGGGPAGLAAALRAVEAGVRPTLIDERPFPGGRVAGGHRPAFGLRNPGPPDGDWERQQRLLSRFRIARERVEVLQGAVAWGLFEGGELGVLHRGRARPMTAAALVLATGAHPRAVPFAGWRLAGVVWGDDARARLAADGDAPGARVLVAGSGAGLPLLANRLAGAGAAVAGVLEAGALTDLGWEAHRLLHRPGLLGDWLRNHLALLRAGIPYRERRVVTAVHGRRRVEEAVVARVDAAGAPVAGSERLVTCDAVVLDWGAVPETALARLVDCAHDHDPRRGGWVPRRTDLLETTQPGIFVAGDAGGLCCQEAAELEGTLAALGALKRLGALGPEDAPAEIAALRRRLARLGKVEAVLARLGAPRPGVWELCPPEEAFCSCQEVRREELERYIGEGYRTLDHLKRRSWAATGICQGRICEPFMAARVAGAEGGHGGAGGWIRARPPVRPIPFGAFGDR